MPVQKKSKKLVGIDEEKASKQAAANTQKEFKARIAENVADVAKHIDRAQISMAVEALQKHVSLLNQKRQEKLGKASLMDDADEEGTLTSKDIVHVQFAIKKSPDLPKLSVSMKEIPLSHPMVTYDDDKDICLFVKDKDEAEKWLSDQKIAVKKVISLQQLRTQYQQFRQRRDLFALYDIFLADERIILMLPKALGRTFYQSQKRPMPVRLAARNHVKGDLKSRINKTLGCSYFSFSGTCSVIRAAKVSFPKEHVVDNVIDCIGGSVRHIPGGWANVQAIHIKTGNSSALPIYGDLPHTIDDTQAPSDSESSEDSEAEKVVEKKRKTPASATKKSADTPVKKSKSTPVKKNGDSSVKTKESSKKLKEESANKMKTPSKQQQQQPGSSKKNMKSTGKTKK